MKINVLISVEVRKVVVNQLCSPSPQPSLSMFFILMQLN